MSIQQNAPQAINLPSPISYDFQIVEYVNDENKVVKVEMQYQECVHDQYGTVISSSGFKAVPRIKVPYKS